MKFPRRTTVVFMGILFWFLITIGIFVNSHVNMNKLKESSIEAAFLNAEVAASLIAQNFNQKASLISTFIQSVGKEFHSNLSDAEIFSRVRSISIPENIIQLSIVDRYGRFIASNISNSSESIDLSDRQHIRVHIDGISKNDLFISQPVRGRVSGVYTLQFTRSIRDDGGRLLFVLVASVPISDITNFYDSLKLSSIGIVSLVGLDGVERVRSGKQEQFGLNIKDTQKFRMISAANFGRYEGISYVDNTYRFGFFKRADNQPFAVVVAYDSQYVLSNYLIFKIGRNKSDLLLSLLLFIVVALAMLIGSLALRSSEEAALRRASETEARVTEAIRQLPGTALLLIGHESVVLADTIGDHESLSYLIAMIEKNIPNYVSYKDSSVATERFILNGAEYEYIFGISRFRGEDGRREDLPKFIVFILDRSESRRDEMRIYFLSKLASLGEIATGLAHEINQPLSVIKIAAQNALAGIRSGKDKQHASEKLARIEAQTVRMAKIIDHMRIFGRRSDAEAAPFSASDAVLGASGMMASQLRLDGIALNVLRACEPDLVLGWRDQIEQVILNLIQNGRDSIQGRRVRLGSDFEGRISITCRVDFAFIVIEVHDNGGGIPADVRPKLFQPFFTTKPAGQGTGLGLPLSFGIIRDHNGTIDARNGKAGAIFTIRLPAVTSSA